MSERTSGPPLRTRLIGRAMTETVARVPFAWKVLRRPMERFFDDLAAGWDERVQPDGADHLRPLVAALDELSPRPPRRVLDVGTGTGAAARLLAQRFPEVEVLGIDVAEEMIAVARERGGDRLRFAVAEPRDVAADGPFDLITHLNCPVLFDDVVKALAPGGTVIVAASSGPRTPFFTSRAALRKGFERSGLRVVGTGTAGDGTWFAAGDVHGG